MATKPKKRPSGFCTALNISVVPSLGCACSYAFDVLLFDCPGALADVLCQTLLLLDQIKPIEQLVPVS
jgi:hypothetical protein